MVVGGVADIGGRLYAGSACGARTEGIDADLVGGGPILGGG